MPTSAFSQVTGDRVSKVEVASDSNAYVGLNVSDSVSKNKVDPLVGVTNSTGSTISVTVQLTDGDGSSSDLYFNGTNVGDSVTIQIDPGNEKTVSVETSLSAGSILNFNVSASNSGFAFDADRTTDVVSGNTSAVKISDFSKLDADDKKDEFTVGKAIGKDDDGDDDLELATFTVFDSNNDKVGETTDSSEIEKNGAEYKLVGGNESITFSSSTDVKKGDTFTFRFKLEDVDGNFATSYVDVTA